jgi:hypothetical protein
MVAALDRDLRWTLYSVAALGFIYTLGYADASPLVALVAAFVWM